MFGWARRFHKLSMIFLLVFSVVLPLAVFVFREILVPGKLWMKGALIALAEYQVSIAESEVFMDSLLFLYVASLGFVFFLFLKNCKRDVRAAARQ